MNEKMKSLTFIEFCVHVTSANFFKLKKEIKMRLDFPLIRDFFLFLSILKIIFRLECLYMGFGSRRWKISGLSYVGIFWQYFCFVKKSL